MKNYEDMSNFEINKLVAKHESLIINESQSTSKNPTAVMVNDIVQSFMFDPCSNPSDAWPIIVENRICIKPHPFSASSWNAVKSSDTSIICITSQRPLRAAMICFLKMKDAQQ